MTDVARRPHTRLGVRNVSWAAKHAPKVHRSRWRQARHNYAGVSLPFLAASGQLMTLTRDGSPVAFTTEAIKGINYAQLPPRPANYAAIYEHRHDGAGDLGRVGNRDQQHHRQRDVDHERAVELARRLLARHRPLTLNATNGVLVTRPPRSRSPARADNDHYYRVTSADGASNSSTSPNPPTAPRSSRRRRRARTRRRSRRRERACLATTPPAHRQLLRRRIDRRQRRLAHLFVDVRRRRHGDRTAHEPHVRQRGRLRRDPLPSTTGAAASDTAKCGDLGDQPAGGVPADDRCSTTSTAQNGSVGSNWVDEPDAFTITSNVVGGQKRRPLHRVERRGVWSRPGCFVTISYRVPVGGRADT